MTTKKHTLVPQNFFKLFLWLGSDQLMTEVSSFIIINSFYTEKSHKRFTAIPNLQN